MDTFVRNRMNVNGCYIFDCLHVTQHKEPFTRQLADEWLSGEIVLLLLWLVQVVTHAVGVHTMRSDQQPASSQFFSVSVEPSDREIAGH